MRSLSTAVVVSVVTAASVWAQSGVVVPDGPERVSIHAQEVPLGQLLRELAGLTPMVLRIDPAVEHVPVSVDLDRVYIEHAIAAVIRESDVDSVVVGLQRMDASTPVRVLAGKAQAAVEVAGIASIADDNVPPKEFDVDVGAPPPLPGDEELARGKDREMSEAAFAESGADADTPGNMTSTEWMGALFPPGRVGVPRGGTMMLPFVDDSGQPIVQPVAAGPRSAAMLPFVDEAGRPVVVPIQDRPDGLVMLPFVENGQPLLVPRATSTGSVPAPASPVPGRPVGPR
jgi:hypothetical protein